MGNAKGGDAVGSFFTAACCLNTLLVSQTPETRAYRHIPGRAHKLDCASSGPDTQLLAGWRGLFCVACYGQSQPTEAAYGLLTSRVFANQSKFYVYLDQDSGFNHGFASGFFPGDLAPNIQVNAGCIDDTTSATGCSTNSAVLDQTRGTVFSVSFNSIPPGRFEGLNIEEPENWGVSQTGMGYDLRGTANLVFDVRSPTSAQASFGMGQCTGSQVYNLTPAWQLITLPISPNCILSNVHILFSVGVANNGQQTANHIVLIDNIAYDPVPASHLQALGFPVSFQTFGALPVSAFQPRPFTVPPDQELRNLTTTYESALTAISFLARGLSQDLQGAALIANTFDYVLHHNNRGDPIPSGANGSVGAHSGFENGDINLLNDQVPPTQGKAGDVRLAGFTIASGCGTSRFCLVLDGATGGNNAFAILALLEAYEWFHDARYLNDARTIGNWIISNLKSGNGYGGYLNGYKDAKDRLQQPDLGKSTENNADIFAAFTALATIDIANGASWTDAANAAGDFVVAMFDRQHGRFNVGTVPSGTAATDGICPTGPSNGTDVINTCDFLDANTFTTLALSWAPRYRNQIDWHLPIQYGLQQHFQQSVEVGGQTFREFDIVTTPTAGQNGVAWEFTGQMCVAMEFLDRLYGDSRFQGAIPQCLSWIEQAQQSAPYADHQGVVASTLQGGDTLPPIHQCLRLLLNASPSASVSPLPIG
jgi:hypothetical protein